MFGRYGGIQNLQIKGDYALVTFETTAQAAQAQRNLNQEIVNYKALQVKFFEPKEQKRLMVEDLLDK